MDGAAVSAGFVLPSVTNSMYLGNNVGDSHDLSGYYARAIVGT